MFKNFKSLMATKTFWVGLLMIGSGIWFLYHPGYDHQQSVTVILAGAGLITGRDAVSKVVTSITDAKAVQSIIPQEVKKDAK